MKVSLVLGWSFLGLFFLTILSQPAAAFSEDAFRNLLVQKYDLDLGRPVLREVALRPESEVLDKDSLGNGWQFSAPTFFFLKEKADFLKITFRTFPVTFAAGQVFVEKEENGRLREIYRSLMIYPDLVVRSTDLLSGRYRVGFSFDEAHNFLATAAIKSYVYVTRPEVYDPQKPFVLLSATAGIFGENFLKIVTGRNAILICDREENLTLLGRNCSFDKLRPAADDLVIVRGDDGAALALVPSWNHRLLMLSPKVFWQESRVSLLGNFLKSWLPVEGQGLSRDLGREILDLYRGLLAHRWIWYLFLIIFLVIVSARLSRAKRINFGALSLGSIIHQSAGLWLRWVGKFRGTFLIIFVSASLGFLLVFFSKDALNLLRDLNFFEEAYLAFRRELPATFKFVGVRHLLEVIFLNIAATAILLAFSDKILPGVATYFKFSLKKVGRRFYIWRAGLLFSFAFFLLIRILALGRDWHLGLLVILLLLLLANELIIAFGYWGSESERSHPGWFLLYLFLLILVPLSDRIRPSFFRPRIPLVEVGSLSGLDSDRLALGLKLPYEIPRLAEDERFDDFQVLPQGALFVGDYLVSYPGVSSIDYRVPTPNAARVSGHRVALYFLGRNGQKAKVSEMLQSLAPFLDAERFAPVSPRATQVDLSPLSTLAGANFLYYVYLSPGRNQVILDYLDLNLSPGPGKVEFNLLSLEGESLFSFVPDSGGYFQVGVPRVRQASADFEIEKAGVYVLEIAFHQDPALLGLTNQFLLKKLTLPTDAFYFLDHDNINAAVDQKVNLRLEVNRTARNPFVFELSEPKAADSILVPNASMNLTIDLSSGRLNLGPVLNEIYRQDKPRSGLRLKYADEAPVLFVAR